MDESLATVYILNMRTQNKDQKLMYDDICKLCNMWDYPTKAEDLNETN